MERMGQKYKTNSRAFVLLLALLLATLPLGAQGLDFKKMELGEALDLAKTENKLVLLDAYASWCGPCKWMDKEVFPVDTIGKALGPHFVPLRIDTEKRAGRPVGEKYGVVAYPTLLIIAPDGRLVHKRVGALEVHELLEFGEEARDSTRWLSTLSRRYAAGERDPAFLLTYFRTRYRAGEPVEAEVERYLSSTPDIEALDSLHFYLLEEFVWDPLARSFYRLVDQHAVYARVVDSARVHQKIINTHLSGFQGAVQRGDMAGAFNIKTQATLLPLPYARSLLTQLDMIDYELRADWGQYADAVDRYLEQTQLPAWQVLNEASYIIQQSARDPRLSQKAALWSEKAVGLSENTFTCDTYAWALYAIGNNEGARVYAEKAIAYGKTIGEDVSSSEELLLRLRSVR